MFSILRQRQSRPTQFSFPLARLLSIRDTYSHAALEEWTRASVDAAHKTKCDKNGRRVTSAGYVRKRDLREGYSFTLAERASMQPCRPTLPLPSVSPSNWLPVAPSPHPAGVVAVVTTKHSLLLAIKFIAHFTLFQRHMEPRGRGPPRTMVERAPRQGGPMGVVVTARVRAADLGSRRSPHCH